MGLNKAMLIARLGKDPEIRYTKSGDPVASFSCATDEGYKDREGKHVEKTEWHSVTAFGKLADFCGNYLKKGSLVYLEGKLQTEEWTDKEGVKRRYTKIIAQTIRFVGPKPAGEKQPEGNKPSEPLLDNDQLDDLPF